MPFAFARIVMLRGLGNFAQCNRATHRPIALVRLHTYTCDLFRDSALHLPTEACVHACMRCDCSHCHRRMCVCERCERTDDNTSRRRRRDANAGARARATHKREHSARTCAPIAYRFPRHSSSTAATSYARAQHMCVNAVRAECVYS